MRDLTFAFQVLSGARVLPLKKVNVVLLDDVDLFASRAVSWIYDINALLSYFNTSSSERLTEI